EPAREAGGGAADPAAHRVRLLPEAAHGRDQSGGGGDAGRGRGRPAGGASQAGDRGRAMSHPTPTRATMSLGSWSAPGTATRFTIAGPTPAGPMIADSMIVGPMVVDPMSGAQGGEGATSRCRPWTTGRARLGSA